MSQPLLVVWVLWSHFTFNANNGAPPQERWDRITTTATESECLTAIATVRTDMRLLDAGPTYRVYAPSNLRPGHSSTTRFSCLPDTTDPRRGVRQ